jgi:hypothetical protein
MIILFGQKAVDLLKRIESLEQKVSMASYAADAALDEAVEARREAVNTGEACAELLKVNRELLEALKKVVAETPALPFERGNAMLGRVSAIRHYLQQMEERSSQ